MQLNVPEARVVTEHAVQEVTADAAVAHDLATVAADAVAGPGEAGELFTSTCSSAPGRDHS
jgi:hypothetical protein